MDDNFKVKPKKKKPILLILLILIILGLSGYIIYDKVLTKETKKTEETKKVKEEVKKEDLDEVAKKLVNKIDKYYVDFYDKKESMDFANKNPKDLMLFSGSLKIQGQKVITCSFKFLIYIRYVIKGGHKCYLVVEK